jgi:hypothetical protein
MAFFNSSVPLLSSKPPTDAVTVSPSIWRVHFSVINAVIWSSFYTRHDQACLIWGVLTAGIFAIAQVVPLSWTTLALIASILTGMGSIGMTWLAWRYTHVDQLAWILYTWLILMLMGTAITNLSVWHGWGLILCNLCPLWLTLCGIGYFITGIGMRSRLILLCSAMHFLSIGFLHLLPNYQLLLTGIVISSSAFLLAEFQWDSNGVCNYQTLN